MVGGPHNNTTAAIAIVGGSAFAAVGLFLLGALAYIIGEKLGVGGLGGICIGVYIIAVLCLAVVRLKTMLDEIEEAP